MWTNWSGTYSVTPQQIVQPRSVDEVVAAVTTASDLSIKAIGAGHSFTDVGLSRGTLIKMDHLRGIIAANPDSGIVTVGAGTRLRDLNEALWDLGLALTNLGDIDAQTISGAISTGTHGTGSRFGGLASQVRGLQLVTAEGELLDCSPSENAEIFEAARLSLGAVGVITAVTLQCEPAFLLHALEAPSTLPVTLEAFGATISAADHFEFYWFPHTQRVLTKTNVRLPASSAGLDRLGRVRAWVDDEFLANTVFEQMNRLTTKRPRLTRLANNVAARALSERSYTDRSYRVFSSPRRVKFREMEYAIPRVSMPYVVQEIDNWIQRSGEHIGFPIGVQVAAPDDVLLSPAYGRDTAYVAVHTYHQQPHEKYFLAVEQIARSVHGRPHWGKLHYRSVDDLASAYPRFYDFLKIRDKLDPARRFSNDYLRRVLGS